MLRENNRVPNQLRPTEALVGVVCEANGSAQYSQGNTAVVSSIYGPSKPRYSRHEDCAKLTLEVDLVTTNYGKVDAIFINSDRGEKVSMAATMTNKKRYEKYIENILKEILLNCLSLANHPGMLMLFKVMVLRDDGSLLACAVNSCYLALLNTGLPIKNAIYAINLGTYNSNESSVYLDLTALEEESIDYKGTFIFGESTVDSQELKLIHSCGSGAVTASNLEHITRNAMETCFTIKQFFKLTIQSYLDK